MLPHIIVHMLMDIKTRKKNSEHLWHTAVKEPIVHEFFGFLIMQSDMKVEQRVQELQIMQNKLERILKQSKTSIKGALLKKR
mmetsp:Transcript_25401/g.50587  ORF Transcript_25401/g.50587 Transcript_25401/m.50587 type:complete len:82 (-) Transcript_25401:165-410(-)